MKNLEKLDRYILEHIDAQDEVLRELERETHLKVIGARMLSGHLQGQVLTLLSKIIRPHRILEIGTFTGYSAICLAKGLSEAGLLFTIEINDELEEIAKKYFAKAGFQKQIIQKTGPALQIIQSLNETFDLVFIDADKKEYLDYYHAVFEKIKPGGIIIADNTLWSGKVVQELKSDDEQTRKIMAFNQFVKNDSRMEKVILPLRDGMTVLRKK